MDTSLRENLVKGGIDDRVAHAYARLSLPAARLSLDAAPDEQILLGAAKYGGLPDVPSTPGMFRLPWHDAAYPLTFVAQIDLAAVAPYLVGDDLWPKDGLLSIFYDAAHAPNGDHAEHAYALRLFYWPAGTPLVRLTGLAQMPPAGRSGFRFVLPSKRASFAPLITAPDSECDEWRLIERQFEVDDPDGPEYMLIRDAWPEHVQYGSHPRHHFGGYAVATQYDPRRYCALRASGWFPYDDGGKPASPSTRPKIDTRDWRLILQLDFGDWRPEESCAYAGTRFYICCSVATIRDRSFRDAWWKWDTD